MYSDHRCTRMAWTVPLISAGISALAWGVAAQAPQSAFDGTYSGTATLQGGRASTACNTIAAMNMRIAGGRVTVEEIAATGLRIHYSGSVDAAGTVSATHDVAMTVSGTIHDGVFTGERSHGHYCYYNLNMRKN